MARARLTLATQGNPWERKSFKKYLNRYRQQGVSAEEMKRRAAAPAGPEAAGGFGKKDYFPETRCVSADGLHLIRPIRGAAKTEDGRWFAVCDHCKLRFALFSERLCHLMGINVQGKES